MYLHDFYPAKPIHSANTTAIPASTGRVVWQNENIRPLGDFETFSIACQGGFFHKGDYLLKAYRRDPGDGRVLGEYGFPFEG